MFSWVLVGEVFRLRSMLANQRHLTSVRIVAIHTPIFAVKLALQ